MNPKERLVTVTEGAGHQEIQGKLHKHRIEKVLMVDDDFRLRGLVTVKDIMKAESHPDAAKDAAKRLLAAAAVGTGAEGEDRVRALVEAGVDILVVDTAHGHSQGVLDRVAWIKQNFPRVEVLVVTLQLVRRQKRCRSGRRCCEGRYWAGIDLYNSHVAGVGVPQVSAIANVASALIGSGIP